MKKWCFAGAAFAFQTQYDNANATRPDVAQQKGEGFRVEVLAPLEKRHSGLMDGVKADMTDEDVNRIFEAGYVRVRGLKHEIDRLRQNYLNRKLTEE